MRGSHYGFYLILKYHNFIGLFTGLHFCILKFLLVCILNILRLFVQIAKANKIIIPAAVAVKFPALEVNYPDGRSLKLPISSHGNEAGTSKMDIPKASLFCLSFRAYSQVWVFGIFGWLMFRVLLKILPIWFHVYQLKI